MVLSPATTVKELAIGANDHRLDRQSMVSNCARAPAFFEPLRLARMRR
jgi:hypothetical protein